MGDVRLFVSHAHKDREIASAVVDLIETALVRDGRILCTSHPNRMAYGYPASNRMDVSEHLRDHLSESSCVVALLTPYSLESRWCLFELGGAWARATKTYPLVAGGVTPAHLPAALKGKLFGKLDDRHDLRRLLSSLRLELGWQPRNMQLAAGDKEYPRRVADAGRPVVTINQLVRRVRETRWPPPPSAESDPPYLAGRHGGERAGFRSWAMSPACALFGAALTYMFTKPPRISDRSDRG